MQSIAVSKKRGILSVVLTLSVLTILLLSGIATAVRVDVETDKSVYSRDNTVVTFISSLDVQKFERIPVTSFTLTINQEVERGIINEDFKVCNFNLDGSNNCGNIIVTPINTGEENQGERVITGYTVQDFNEPERETNDFGYGYGFIEEARKSGLNGELAYEIKWDLDADQVPNARYTAQLEANTGTDVVYTKRAPESFQVSLDERARTTILNRADVFSREATAIQVATDSGFTESRSTFTANLRHTQKAGVEEVDGKVNLVLHAEKDNNKIYVKIDFRDLTLNSFGRDSISLNSNAFITYRKTTDGSQVTSTSGYVDGAAVTITPTKVTLTSNDGIVDFDIELTPDSFDFS